MFRVTKPADLQEPRLQAIPHAVPRASATCPSCLRRINPTVGSIRQRLVFQCRRCGTLFYAAITEAPRVPPSSGQELVTAIKKALMAGRASPRRATPTRSHALPPPQLSPASAREGPRRPSGSSLAAANRELEEVLRLSSGRREADRQRWHAVEAIDRVCSLLETARLDGISLDAEAFATIARLLSSELGRLVPESARDAKTIAALHARLLDWQETLLDEALPARRVFTENDAVEEIQTTDTSPASAAVWRQGGAPINLGRPAMVAPHRAGC